MSIIKILAHLCLFYLLFDLPAKLSQNLFAKLTGRLKDAVDELIYGNPGDKNLVMYSENLINQMLDSLEEEFGTANDPNQPPVSHDTFNKLTGLYPKSVLIETTDDGEYVGEAAGFPTTQKLMKEFLDSKLTEKELWGKTLAVRTNVKNFDAYYIMSVHVKPDMRRLGWGSKIFRRYLKNIRQDFPKVPLFGWVWSKEGENLAKKLEKETGETIKTKK